jgi:4a-hydroxytetrahydrobiopterin dehydratase
MTDNIFSRQFHAATGAEAWRVLPEGAYAFFASDSFALSARFVDDIGRLVADGDAPDIDVRRDGVTVLVRAFKGGDFGLVQADLDLARAISNTAHELGLTGDPAAIQSLSVISGATDRRAIMPFWQVVLGYDRRPDVEEGFWTLSDAAGNEVDVATTSAPDPAA